MTVDPIAEQRARDREAKIAEFALATIAIAVQISGGKMPIDEDARSLVRLARIVYDEIDRPSPPPPEPERAPAPPNEPTDLVEELYGAR
jgi:hypothetical protein